MLLLHCIKLLVVSALYKAYSVTVTLYKAAGSVCTDSVTVTLYKAAGSVCTV